MSTTQNTATMNNVTTTDLGYMTIEITEMPVNNKGREMGWPQQFKEVTTFGPDNGYMSGMVFTTYYWKGRVGRHMFRCFQKQS